MENIVLGKVLKAMQKLSGKSVCDLADATGLTVDTVNNLFYARVQKPSFVGVCSLAESMGFSVQLLLMLMRDERVSKLEPAQIMELISDYSENGTISIPVAQKASSGADDIENERYERQLDRFRATHLGYVEQIKRQYEAQLEQADEHSRVTIQGLEKLLSSQRALTASTADRYEKQLLEIRSVYDSASESLKTENERLRKLNSKLCALIFVELAAIIIALLLFVH